MVVILKVLYMSTCYTNAVVDMLIDMCHGLCRLVRFKSDPLAAFFVPSAALGTKKAAWESDLNRTMCRYDIDTDLSVYPDSHWEYQTHGITCQISLIPKVLIKKQILKPTYHVQTLDVILSYHQQFAQHFLFQNTWRVQSHLQSWTPT